jgi:threonine/homoserine/homoserine lactone efflux protein
MIWTALGETLPQAVAIAISPIPLVLVILVLVSERRRSTGPAFGAGWVLGVFATTAVAAALAQGADVGTDPEAADAGSLAQVLFGLLFLLLAVRQWRKRPSPGVSPETPTLFRTVEAASGPKTFGIGVTAAAANPKNLPLTASAGIAIAQTGMAGAELVTAVVLFSVVASAIVLGLVVAVLVLGERTRQPLDALKDWLIANNATIMIVLFAVLGALMLGSGLSLVD